MARHFERLFAGPPPKGQSEAVATGILRDQFADLRKGIFISMPVGTVLSALVLLVQLLSHGGLDAVLWFATVSIINGARLVLAVSRPNISDGD